MPADQGPQDLAEVPPVPGAIAGDPTVRYTERLGPPAWAWVVVLSLCAAMGVAFGVPLGLLAGLISFGVFAALCVWFLLATTPTIVVTGQELRIGRVHIGLEYIGLVATLDAESTTAARGPHADTRAFLISRPLSAKESVTLEIIDDEDPHPYWLISTRHPQKLGQAIRRAQTDLDQGPTENAG